MDDFATHADNLVAQTDVRLGDSISYKVAGGAFVTKKGRLLFDDPASASWPSRDPAKQTVSLRISKAQLPTEPSKNDRIQSPLLDGTYRPLGRDVLGAGRYWLTGLQKV